MSTEKLLTHANVKADRTDPVALEKAITLYSSTCRHTLIKHPKTRAPYNETKLRQVPSKANRILRTTLQELLGLLHMSRSCDLEQRGRLPTY